MAPISSPMLSKCWCRPCEKATSYLWITCPPTRARVGAPSDPEQRFRLIPSTHCHGRGGGDRGRRSDTVLSGGLLTGPQPDRASILKTQSGSAQGCGPHRHEALEADWVPCQGFGPEECANSYGHAGYNA